MKKPNWSSKTERMRIAKAVSEDLKPHLKLNLSQKRHWDRIIAHRANADWPPLDLVMACYLAMLLHDMDVLRRQPQPDPLEVKALEDRLTKMRRDLNLHQVGKHSTTQAEARRMEHGRQTQAGLAPAFTDRNSIRLLK